MLEVNNLQVAYGESEILNQLSFSVGKQETVAIMGRNGMGKTTLMKALIGILRSRKGSIELDGHDLTRLDSFQPRLGRPRLRPARPADFPHAHCRGKHPHRPGDRQTAADRPLDLHAVSRPQRDRRRRGGNLSGGQQQQLAIARALVSEPKVLLVGRADRGDSALDHQGHRPHAERDQESAAN